MIWGYPYFRKPPFQLKWGGAPKLSQGFTEVGSLRGSSSDFFQAKTNTPLCRRVSGSHLTACAETKDQLVELCHRYLLGTQKCLDN